MNPPSAACPQALAMRALALMLAAILAVVQPAAAQEVQLKPGDRLGDVFARMVVVELGASDRISAARAQSEHLTEAGAHLIRVCAAPTTAPHGAIVIQQDVATVVEAIDERLLS